jgi:hypothetical protein
LEDESMPDRKRAMVYSAAVIAATLVFSILLAVIRKGSAVLGTLNLAHMFIIFCVVGSVFYTIIKFQGARELIFSIFIVTLLHLLVFRVTEPRYFLDFFFYYAALGLSVLIYARYVASSMKNIIIGKFIILAALIVFVYSAVTILVSVFSDSGRSLGQTLLGILTVHSLTGIALGLGIEVGELIASRISPAPEGN